MKPKPNKSKSESKPPGPQKGESGNGKVAIIALSVLLAYQSAVGLFVNSDLVEFHAQVHSSVEKMGAAFEKKNWAAVVVNSKGAIASDDKELEKANADLLAAVDAASICDDRCQQNLRVFTWSSLVALGVGITVLVASLFRLLGFRRD
jgi:hypothetical protein